MPTNSYEANLISVYPLSRQRDSIVEKDLMAASNRILQVIKPISGPPPSAVARGSSAAIPSALPIYNTTDLEFFGRDPFHTACRNRADRETTAHTVAALRRQWTWRACPCDGRGRDRL